MSNDVVASYDAIPYEGGAFLQSHPDQLATVAFLMGLTPAPIVGCRVLELGCGMGRNLVPMAAALPGSHFTGVDLSPRHITAARGLAETLGLSNIQFDVRDIADLDDLPGRFDYIISHGVYSWVKPEVQETILAACKRLLAPQGVAYISYNTYPGWHLRYIAREWMLFHTRACTAAAEKVREARTILTALVESCPPECTYHRVLKDEAEVVRASSDWYVSHEHLEPSNFACYFLDFMQRARTNGLQFLGESGQQVTIEGLPETLRETIEAHSSDRLDLEQYLDFALNRTFRTTLLCHADLQVSPRPLAQRLMKCGLTAAADPATDGLKAASSEPVEFLISPGRAVMTDEPIVKAALLALHEAWPQCVPFDELWRLARTRLPEPPPDLMRSAFGMMLVQCWLSNVLHVTVTQTPFVLTPGERPAAFAVARYQAQSGSLAVCNLRHQTVTLDEVTRQLIGLMDGTRDRATLRRELGDPEDFDRRLQNVARQAFLVEGG